MTLIQTDMRWRWIILALLSPLILGIFYIALGIFGPEDRGYWDFCGDSTAIESGFQQFFIGKTHYPAYSLEQLRKLKAFDPNTQELMDEYWVYYTPFSSQTPDDKVVLRIGYGPLSCIPWLCDFSITKYELTHDLQAEALQWSDRLQETTAKQVHQFIKEHPSYSVVAANPWWKGTTPQNSHAELTIAYRKPEDTKTYEEHYSFLPKNDDWVLDVQASK
jgi:hypothetical protein